MTTVLHCWPLFHWIPLLNSKDLLTTYYTVGFYFSVRWCSTSSSNGGDWYCHSHFPSRGRHCSDRQPRIAIVHVQPSSDAKVITKTKEWCSKHPKYDCYPVFICYKYLVFLSLCLRKRWLKQWFRMCNFFVVQFM